MNASPTLHAHREAYALMNYESADGLVREVIWNSRDGVTPFGVTAKDGTTPLTHARWHEDQYAPNHVPALGDRIFVDLTPERAKTAAMRNAERWWDDPKYPASQTGRWVSVEHLVAALAESYLAQPGAPDLVVVAG